MKSFDDFLSTLSTNDKDDIMKKSMSVLTNSGKTFSEKDMVLATLIAQTSATFYRELLRRYHEWLSEQM